MRSTTPAYTGYPEPSDDGTPTASSPSLPAVATTTPAPLLRGDLQMLFGQGDLREVRRLVSRTATQAGIGEMRVDELVLAVNELVANSVDHGGGHGVLRLWVQAGALVVEVHDQGTGPPEAIVPTQVGPDDERGRGLWLAHRLADLVQVRRTPTGTVARVVTWLDRS